MISLVVLIISIIVLLFGAQYLTKKMLFRLLIIAAFVSAITSIPNAFYFIISL